FGSAGRQVVLRYPGDRAGRKVDMALRSATVILPLTILAAFLTLAPAFLSAPSTRADSSLRGAGGTGMPEAVSASGVTAALLSSVPEPAHAFSENELNQFGLVFALFFLGFFIAGLVRMFTVGKL
ncbi:unnamed protein product, partial [Effrenium voratum]